jgi:hypothetical protein
MKRLIPFIMILLFSIPSYLDLPLSYENLYARFKNQYSQLSNDVFEVTYRVCISKQRDIGVMLALFYAESRFDKNAHSWADARGLGQNMPYWYAGDVTDLYDPLINVCTTWHIIDTYMKRGNDNLFKLIKSYERGPNSKVIKFSYMMDILENIAKTYPDMKLVDLLKYNHQQFMYDKPTIIGRL